LEVIVEGSMLPSHCTVFGRHSEAKLATSELQTLIAGVKATPGLSDRGRWIFP
jgi:hypothetical protein